MYNVCWCDAMTKDVRREETSKFAALSECTNNDEICFVMQHDTSLRQSPSCLREISVSAVDKGVYIWVSSAYK